MGLCDERRDRRKLEDCKHVLIHTILLSLVDHPPSFMESDGSDWQAILHGNHQVVLYHPTSRALVVTGSQNTDAAQIGWEDYTPDDVEVEDLCPYCHRPMTEDHEQPGSPYPRAPNYFHLLAESTSSSRPRTPPGQESSGRLFGADAMADGYFDTFFREERKLGMGANGSVFLCQHVLDGNTLGHFAVKKIAVGSSHEYLLKILHEASPSGKCCGCTVYSSTWASVRS